MRPTKRWPGFLSLIAGIALLAIHPGEAQNFSDAFDGDTLAERWTVVNPDENAYRVEDGNLVLLASQIVADDAVGAGEMANLFTADSPLPEGNWTMSVRFSADFLTVRESLVFGLMDDGERYVLADIHTDGDGNRGWQLNAAISKRSGASRSRFSDAIARLRCNVCGTERSFETFVSSIAMPIDAQIVKSGSEYTFRVRLGSDSGTWRRIATVISINPPVRPVLAVRQRETTDAETVFRIDDFRIEPLQQ